jgi:hypothetical protein
LPEPAVRRGGGSALKLMPVDIDAEEANQSRRSAAVVRGMLDRVM